MTARYSCDFMGTVQAPRANHAITVRGPYECPTIPQLPYDLFLRTCPLKIVCVLHDHSAASERRPYRDSAMAATISLRGMGLRFLKICINFFLTNRAMPVNRESVRKSLDSRLPPHRGRREREIRAACGLRRHIASHM